MANTITDNRTLIHAANVVTPYDSLAGSASGTLDTEIKVEGTGSVGWQIGSSRVGLLHDAGAVVTAYANSVFYIRVNCGIVGLLDTKANGGFTVRFCGNTVTNFFEVYVGGSDSWPTAIAGGWVTFVVDIELAHTNSDNTGGTKPATNAIRYVGCSGITGGTMPRMTDNTWSDASYYLPDGNAGILIQGQSGGSTPWSFADIYTQLGDAAGTFVPAAAGGAYVCNTPITIGVDDATAHAFTDSNAVVLWADQEFAPSDLYKIKVAGAVSGTVNVNLGIKTGTGDAATGAQGCLIAAAASGVRWTFEGGEFQGVDACNLYGCTFIHGGAMGIGSSAATVVETISTSFIDCTSAIVANSLFLRNKVIDPNTADGVAFATTDDLTDIRFCTFEFSDGHAVGLVGTLDATQESRGNLFVGAFGGTPGDNLTASSGSTDAMIYNNQGGFVTISVTNGGTTPSIRNGASATTAVVNNVNVTLTGMRDNSEVRVYDNAALASRVELAGIETVTAGTADNRSFTFGLPPTTIVNIVVFVLGYEPVYFNAYTIPASDASLPVSQKIDRTYVNP